MRIESVSSVYSFFMFVDNMRGSDEFIYSLNKISLFIKWVEFLYVRNCLDKRIEDKLKKKNPSSFYFRGSTNH